MPVWAERSLTILCCLMAAWVAFIWPEIWTGLMLLVLISVMFFVAAWQHHKGTKK